jgi:hypothetical protein
MRITGMDERGRTSAYLRLLRRRLAFDPTLEYRKNLPVTPEDFFTGKALI